MNQRLSKEAFAPVVQAISRCSCPCSCDEVGYTLHHQCLGDFSTILSRNFCLNECIQPSYHGNGKNTLVSLYSVPIQTKKRRSAKVLAAYIYKFLFRFLHSDAANTLRRSLFFVRNRDKKPSAGKWFFKRFPACSLI